MTHQTTLLALPFLHAISMGCSPPPCNGSAALCDTMLSEVTFPTTHNANSALEYGYSYANANHTYGIQRQLEAGIRAMMLDVTYYEGNTALCHGPCNLGNTPHTEALGWVKDFLEANPREIIVFLYQDSISTMDLEDDFQETGLDQYVITLDLNNEFPTLEALIENEQRLLVTTEHASAPPNWVHHLWDVAWDTPYSFDNPSDFSCDLNRGESSNPLFLINHWLSGPYGVPSESEAETANDYDALLNRALKCWEQSGQRPNFLAVDWFEVGDLIPVVTELNERSF